MNLGADSITLAGQVAAWMTAAGGVIIVLWKFRLWFRADARQDKAAESIGNAAALIVVSLEREIDRLRAVVDDLERRLRECAKARYDAEHEAHGCRKDRDIAVDAAERANRRVAAANEVALQFKAQISALEMDVRRLEHGPPAMNGGGENP